jgi:hypothetical protein
MSSTLSAATLVGLLAEDDRRLVAAALILAPGDVDDVMTATGLDRRSVVTALDRLTATGLVEAGSDGQYLLLGQAFKLAARAQAEARAGEDPADEGVHEAVDEAVDGAVDGGAGDGEAAKVLSDCIVDGRLVRLPRKRAKRLIVLDHLAQLFEPGEHYTERQVNAALSAFDEDVATLRRYLVDEYFLDRADGNYWRSGGSVDT